MSRNNFGGGMKIACLKYYCVHFQLFLLKRFYSLAQIVLYHASWRSIWLTRNKAFFFVQKEGEIDINFALRKKRLEGVAKKIRYRLRSSNLKSFKRNVSSGRGVLFPWHYTPPYHFLRQTLWQIIFKVLFESFSKVLRATGEIAEFSNGLYFGSGFVWGRKKCFVMKILLRFLWNFEQVCIGKEKNNVPISLSPYSDTSAYPLHTWIVLLN